MVAPPPVQLFPRTRVAPVIRSPALRAQARRHGPTPQSIPLLLFCRNKERRRVRPAPRRTEVPAVATAKIRDRGCRQYPWQFLRAIADSASLPAFRAAQRKSLPAASAVSLPAVAGSQAPPIRPYLRTISGCSSKLCPLPQTKKLARTSPPTTDLHALTPALPQARHSPASRSGYPNPVRCISRRPASPRSAASTSPHLLPTSGCQRPFQSRPRPGARRTPCHPAVQQRQVSEDSCALPTLLFITLHGVRRRYRRTINLWAGAVNRWVSANAS